MVKMKKNNGFSLVEVLLTLSVLGGLFAIAVSAVPTLMPNADLAKFKKAYSVTEFSVRSLLDNEVLYGGSGGFLDTTPVELSSNNTIIGYNGKAAKFREAMQYVMTVAKSGIDCPLPAGFSCSLKNCCYKTDDGVVWGIPDTDFDSRGVATITEEGIKYNYAPIAVYTNFENKSKIKNAYIIGVDADGRIALLGGTSKLKKLTIRESGSTNDIDPKLECPTTDENTKEQCQAIIYLRAKSVRKRINE